MSLFVALMLPILLTLGVWQSNRADYKDELQGQFAATLGSMPAALDVTKTGLRRLRIAGTYGSQQFLLDNQIREGQVGYWLLQPFRVSGSEEGQLVLVNRGWLPAPPRRDQLPDVPAAPGGTQSLLVLQWPDLGALPSFGAASTAEALAPNLWRLQRLDWTVLTPRVAPDLMTAEMRLEAGQAGVLQPAPTRLGFGADRHRGYAFQWFGLALTLVIGFIVYGLKRS